jgi:hypothetical protein
VGIRGRLFPGVYALAVYQGELYAGGYFEEAGGTDVQSIARWDGTKWYPLADGGVAGGKYPSVFCMTVYNDVLVVGGNFWKAGDKYANRLATWNGFAWSQFGAGMDDWVSALTVYEGDLIAGGWFSRAGCVAANNVARWDGEYWTPVGSGTNDPVWSLTTYGDGLIAGGFFTEAGGVPANRIARYDENGWIALGSGADYVVRDLTVDNDHLFAVGYFLRAGGRPSYYIGEWMNPQWSPPPPPPPEEEEPPAGDGEDVAGRDENLMEGQLPSPDVVVGPVLSSGTLITVPNPYRPHQAIYLQPDAAGFAEVTVFNVHGQRLQTLLAEPVGLEQLQLTWDGRTASGARAPAGIYFVSARVGDAQARRTIVLRR